MAKKTVKELIKEVEGAISVLEGVKAYLADETADTKKADSKEKAEPEDEDEDGEGEADGREAELEGMSYNELKALVKELGGKAVGKKPDLIKIILELEADADDSDAEDEEDDNEDVMTEEEAREQLEELEKADLKKIAEHMGIKVLVKDTAKKLIDKIVADLEGLDSALEELGFYDEDDSDDGDDEDEADDTESADEDDSDDEDDEENSLVEDLNSFEQEELASICADNGLSAKGKKQALIDRLVEAVENGDITEDDIFGDEDEEDSEDGADEDEMSVEEIIDDLDADELKDLAKELGINTKKVKKSADIKKAILKKDEDEISDALESLGLVGDDDDIEDTEDDGDEEDDTEGMSDEAIEAMDKVEKDIRAKYKAKKLKDATIKKFVNKYYDGDPDMSDLDKEEYLEEYIHIQRSLVDDEGELHDLGDPYERNEESYCCGAKLVPGKGKKKGTLICEICGEEYKEVED